MPDGAEPKQPVASDVYVEMVSSLMSAEFDRRKGIEARGAVILTASATLLTLIFGLTVVVTGKDHVFANHSALIFLLFALASFIISAVLAIVVQGYAFRYTVTGVKTLQGLTSNAFWLLDHDTATRMWVQRQVNTTLSLRAGNDVKATLVLVALGWQVVAVVLLSASIGLEMWGRV
ncbi:hypothetical protein OG976_05655 [Mycobacterium sp. NBC_00419]|uniref:hypothetical protein n=1 Tax=Mycobacterium sp. NBC_00419 TaxID=2975989 RepID=UPI002E23DFBC